MLGTDLLSSVSGADPVGDEGEVARAASTLPSSCRFGVIRSSHRGIHQALAPNSDITAGTSTIRTILASMSTAAAMPIASIFTVGSGSSTKLVNTTTMIAAAVVMTRAVLPIPMATLRWESLVCIQASCTRESRKTS